MLRLGEFRGMSVAAAGTANDQFQGKHDAMAFCGVLTPRNPLKEQVGSHLPNLIHGLANDGKGGLKHVRHVEVVKADQRDLTRNVNAEHVESMQQIAHGQVVSGKESSRWLGLREQRMDRSDRALS